MKKWTGKIDKKTKTLFLNTDKFVQKPSEFGFERAQVLFVDKSTN